MKRQPKRCARCGNIYLALPRERRCKRSEQRMGRLFYCWGLLTAAPKPKREKAQKIELRPQEIAQSKLQAERRKITRWYFELGELAKQQARIIGKIQGAQRTVDRLEVRALMTDAEIEAERQALRERFRKKVKKTRAIVLEELGAGS